MGKVKPKYAILFGFKRDDEDDLAYYAIIDGKITTTSEEALAHKFLYKRKRNQVGFGTPQQWLAMINEDPHLNNGYKFHIVNKY